MSKTLKFTIQVENMEIVSSINEMIGVCDALRKEGKKIGFVPTMGALHKGHISLLSISQKYADVSIMSIFVNPTQFGPNEDYIKYPRPFDADIKKAEEAGCDVLFAPTVEEMYPQGFCTTVSVGGITERLCGIARPTHFKGVTTVVLKLFNIVNPHYAVFGAKDAQQVIVIRRMVADLHCPVKIIVGPIIREADGLALSSRNSYLTFTERSVAPFIYKGLSKAEELFSCGERRADILIAEVNNQLQNSGLIVPEYIEVADIDTLEPVSEIQCSALLAVACRMKESNTRLIDNTVLGGKL